MDKPKRNLERKARTDMKVGNVKVRRIVKKDITKEEFLTNLEKFAKPVKPSESGSEKSET